MDANTQTYISESWEELYAAAVLETDPSKLEQRIDMAEGALRERWKLLLQLPHARDRERRRVEDAMRTLNLIREAELRTPA